MSEVLKILKDAIVEEKSIVFVSIEDNTLNFLNLNGEISTDEEGNYYLEETFGGITVQDLEEESISKIEEYICKYCDEIRTNENDEILDENYLVSNFKDIKEVIFTSWDNYDHQVEYFARINKDNVSNMLLIIK